MKKSRKFLSMPIISLAEGLKIGSVRSLVVDPVKMEVAALIVDQRGWFREQKIIPFSKVKSIGSDAVTIDQTSNVQKPISLPELLKLLKERTNPIGNKVIAENGTEIGIVDEFYVDEATGKITGLEVSGKLLESLYKGKAFLPIENVSTIGDDIIVVTKDAQSSLEKLDGGLQETIHNIKEGTTSILESTIQRTKEISKTIKEKYDKIEKSKEKSSPGNNDSAPEETIVEPDPNLDVTGKVEIKNTNVLPQVLDADPGPETQQSESQADENPENQKSPAENLNPEQK
ncbi:MAG: PRC-barrel domain-containing protein [Thermincola sp.]|nr:PRC-barrel domain-containing protein [Thermincola sp.]MDT3702113.1 PRC-barrel domain-containing protein [Thermincola sp.]